MIFIIFFFFTNEGHLMNERRMKKRKHYPNEIRTRRDSFFHSPLVTFQKYIKTK